MRAMRRLARGTDGQAIVELALVLPVVLMILFGITEFGRALHAYLAIQNAAREGVRLGITGAGDDAIRDRVVAMAGTLESERLTVGISPLEGERLSGDVLTVSVRYDFVIVVPLIAGIVGGEIPLESALSMRME